MKILKKYTYHFLYTIISILLSLLLIITLYYFNILPINIYQTLKLILFLVIILLSGILLGKKATSKGYLEGIKLGLFFIILFTVTSLLTSANLHIKVLLYDCIILITAILGGMIGINKK